MQRSLIPFACLARSCDFNDLGIYLSKNNQEWLLCLNKSSIPKKLSQKNHILSYIIFRNKGKTVNEFMLFKFSQNIFDYTRKIKCSRVLKYKYAN